MTKKNKSPLQVNLEDINIDKAMNLTSEELKTLGLDKEKLFEAQQKATFTADQTLGVGAGALTGKKVDNSALNTYLKEIEKPTGPGVYSKLGAMYRSQGEGAVLRTQRDLSNLFLPTLDLIKKREAAAMARFTLLKSRMPEFDDSVIFGDQTGNPMPIADEIKTISTDTREDLRQLSRLNPMDERYEEIKKRVEKNQKILVEFDAVNQQLIKIRNEGTDESQWSRGMDETTTDMWRDIYTSNGKNIKIQDGKLVWTDERGITKYKFDDISDVGPKRKALGYNHDTDYNNDSDLGVLHYLTMDGSNQATRSSGYFNTVGDDNVKLIQKSLNNLGFTDDNGNKLEVDGNFGDKTEQAYKKYLAKKDELEQAYLDENLSEEDKQKYGVTTGIGETRIIDLSQIGDGPTTIDNAAVNKDIEIRGNVATLINNGVGLDDPMYNTLIRAKVFELNSVGPNGIKSLIFDGLRNDEDSIYNGINTDEFLEQVIRNHYGNDLNESEIVEKIEVMRSGDVTQMYNNGKGGQDTLQTQFMEWYKNTIDKKIEEGVKSKIAESLSGGRGTRTGGASGTSDDEFGEYEIGQGGNLVDNQYNKNRLSGYSGYDSSVGNYTGTDLRGEKGYYSTSGAGELYENPYKLVDEIWTKSTGMEPGEYGLTADYSSMRYADAETSSRYITKTTEEIEDNILKNLRKRFGLFEFKLARDKDGNIVDGYIEVEYKINKKQAKDLIKKGVNKNFMDKLRGDKEVGGYAEIGEKGTFEPDQDGGILYPKMTFEAFNYEKLRQLLRYMNRVTGYYAFQESRFLNNPNSINKGVSQNQ
tara:strand:- start:1886 stop:4321 length:2436 start_codon:yes stop_codon:yes gene_type:complete